MSKIVLTGGGTAGHVSPNMALIPYLKKYFDKIFYIGSNNGIEKDICKKNNVEFYSTTTVKFQRKAFLKNFLIPIKLVKAENQAEDLLLKLKPDVVFSKGGYVSIPTVIAADKLKIPVITHESDLTLGLANKLIKKHSQVVLTSFPETAEKIKNGKFVGSPIRKELFNYRKSESLSYFNLKGTKPVLLITGGSQGAKAINDITEKTVDILLNKFDIIHICGKNNFSTKEKPGYVRIDYLNEIGKAFSACDICVSRAGSNTIFELLAFSIPTLLIPLPKGNSRGDQILNAEYFYKKGLVDLLYQENLTDNSFIMKINSLYLNRLNYKKAINENKFKNPNENIAKIIYSYVN